MRSNPSCDHPGGRLTAALTSHSMLVGIFLAFTLWYLLDAWRADVSATNLVLVLPAGVAVLALGVGLFLSDLRTRQDNETVVRGAGPIVRPGTLPMIGLIYLYVVLLGVIGFAAATFLFLVAALRLLGTRRPLSLLLFPAIFTALLMIGLTLAVRLPDPWIVSLWQGRQ